MPMAISPTIRPVDGRLALDTSVSLRIRERVRVDMIARVAKRWPAPATPDARLVAVALVRPGVGGAIAFPRCQSCGDVDAARPMEACRQWGMRVVRFRKAADLLLGGVRLGRCRVSQAAPPSPRPIIEKQM